VVEASGDGSLEMKAHCLLHEIFVQSHNGSRSSASDILHKEMFEVRVLCLFLCALAIPLSLYLVIQ
jgi:hypothetical protein